MCVTGAGGFIASWIVKQLLEKLHGNNAKCGHLKQLPGAGERLKLLKAGVLDYNLADVLVPGITGTEDVMRGCSEDPHCKIKRVVMTSSGTAVMCDSDRPEDKMRWYWSLRRQHGLELVVVCLCDVFGPLLQQTMNTSNEYLKLWKGVTTIGIPHARTYDGIPPEKNKTTDLIRVGEQKIDHDEEYSISDDNHEDAEESLDDVVVRQGHLWFRVT
ncbi:cinnamoyl-CoA reductase 1 [Selaginella moellendorffii]|uniref:cinnamoyl-CoA reductase 1 n=1 Tax=Selaginella moellendorffii TaxID=88036 RepID=UPI000D1CE14A|nr:cinnamoyl-CoA reductase 1 [Selaginella moellendorffii]|eukprot:XP_024536109.1 cinnamoyl-CoA reductase 1 [Selaginella moellendorffii]